MYTTYYRTVEVADTEVFYREAGPRDVPVFLLLHGFPMASQLFRELMPLLASRYRVIAPDLPGFTNTRASPRGEFACTFDNLALPEQVAAIISQNGNAFLGGFSGAWGVWQTYWREPTAAHREACRDSLSAEVIRRWQDFNRADPERISPDGYTLDIAYRGRSGAEELQLELILDFHSNVKLYRKFQAYFRKWQPPFLAAWGRRDAHVVPAGAQAYRRDLPRAGGSCYRAMSMLVHILFVGLLAAAWAAAGPALSTSEASFLSENEIAMTRMMKAMANKPSGDVDKDFVGMMVPHHQGAIDMAIAVLRHSHNDRIRRLAQEIIVTQQQEIVAMRFAVGERPPASAVRPTTEVPSIVPAPLQQHRGIGMP